MSRKQIVLILRVLAYLVWDTVKVPRKGSFKPEDHHLIRDIEAEIQEIEGVHVET